MKILQGEKLCPCGTKVHPPLFLQGTLWGKPGAGFDMLKIIFINVDCIFLSFKGGWNIPFPDKDIVFFGCGQHQFFKIFFLIRQGRGAYSYIWCFGTIYLSNP